MNQSSNTMSSNTNTTKLTPEQLMVITKVTVKLAELGHEVIHQHPITSGPIVTTYRFAPKGQAKVKQLEALASDLAMVLAVEDVMIKRLTGESVIGITIPNRQRIKVLWRDTVTGTHEAEAYTIPLNFGVDEQGRSYYDDLAALPHLLIAGSTGSGKSTLLGSLISTLIYTRSSHDIQFVLSDTKNVEFGYFIGAPHLVCDPTTTVYQTWEKMDWLGDETERRLKRIAAAGKRNIAEYNASVDQSDRMSRIVFVIDELADILGSGGRGEAKVAEAKLSKIVQKSRAAGIYVIAATQRPSVNVVSGSIKANFPARLTFRLPSEADSRTVIGTNGAEHLLSQGDMLFASPNRPNILRLHSAYADINDLKGAVDYATMKHQMEVSR